MQIGSYKTKKEQSKTYIFHRGDMWYPIEMYDDADAIRGAHINIGTTKVETLEGKVIWELKTKSN